MEVKSYTTQGSLRSIQKQGRRGCSILPLATPLQTRTQIGAGRSVDVGQPWKVFCTQEHLCCTVSEMQSFGGGGGGDSLLSPSHVLQ